MHTKLFIRTGMKGVQGHGLTTAVLLPGSSLSDNQGTYQGTHQVEYVWRVTRDIPAFSEASTLLLSKHTHTHEECSCTIRSLIGHHPWNLVGRRQKSTRICRSDVKFFAGLNPRGVLLKEAGRQENRTYIGRPEAYLSRWSIM